MTRRRAVLLCAFLLAGLPGPARGQLVVRFSRPQLTLGTEFDGNWRSRPEGFGTTRVREFAHLLVGASLGRYNFLSVNANYSPYLGQGWIQPNPDSLSLSQDGLLGSLRVDLFPGRSVSGSATASRRNSYVPNEIGGDLDLTESRWAVELKDRNPLLPLTVSYTERDSDQLRRFRPRAAPVSLQRTIRDFRFNAHNWKTQILLRQFEIDRVANGRPDESLMREGRVMNRFTWGKGSRMQNQARYLGRQGDETSRSWSLGSDVELLHTRKVSSQYRWAGNWSRGEGWTRDTQRYRASLSYGAVGRKAIQLEGEHYRSRLGEFRTVATEAGPRWLFDHAFRPRMVLSGELRARFRWREFETPPGTYNYVLEERQIFGSDGQVRLDNPFADSASLVVRSVAGTQYLRGFDYEVVEEGPFLVLIALPGGEIREETEVLLSYRYEEVTSVGSSAGDYRARARLQMGRLALTYNRLITDDLGGPHTGQGRSLTDRDLESVALQYSLQWARVQISAHGGLSWSRWDQGEVARRTGSLAASSRITRRLNAALGTRWNTSTGGEAPSTQSTSSARVGWTIARPLKAEFRASYYRWAREDQELSIMSLGTQFSLTLGRTLASLSVDTFRYGGADPYNEHRVSLGFSQAF